MSREMDPRIYRRMDRCEFDFKLMNILKPLEKEMTYLFFSSFFNRTYPVYAVGEAGTMYTPASNQYYTSASTPVTYAQVSFRVMMKIKENKRFD